MFAQVVETILECLWSHFFRKLFLCVVSLYFSVFLVSLAFAILLSSNTFDKEKHPWVLWSLDIAMGLFAVLG
ncbi:unnamed protein product, partial [Heterosigma akashiwo]